MPPPEVKVIGLHPLIVTPELVASSIDVKFDRLELSEADMASAREHVERELSSVFLLELEIHHRDDAFDAGDFGQAGSEQAAYMEAYLSADGSAVIATDYDVPTGDTLRVAFFLHFLDPQKPLVTSYGEVELPPSSPMPARLARLVPYEPVD